MPQRFVIAFLLTTSFALCCKIMAQSPAISGQWEGTVQVPGDEFRVVIDLAQRDQQWTGSLTAQEFGMKGAPLSRIAVQQGDIAFEWNGTAHFKGHLEPGGELKGEYQQGGNRAPFSLKRVGDAHVDYPELSTPMSKDLQGGWTGSFELLNLKINVDLKLANNSTPSTPAGELHLIDWGNQNVPIVLWKQQDNRIFAMLGNGMSYEAEFHKDTMQIAGNLRISYLELPLVLHPGSASTSASPAPAAHAETK